MKMLTKRVVEKAIGDSPWHFANKVLYDLCRDHPKHVDKHIVIAKVLLIGRAYAAAIERRKTKQDGSDDFYLKTVGPQICNSKIDTWIESTYEYSNPSVHSTPSVLTAHNNLTTLFKKISGLEKRSLASKYLHFHRPELFFIYDSRAEVAMRELSHIVGRAERSTGAFDNNYRKFTNKCLALRDHINEQYGCVLNPRQIDNLLLSIHSRHK